MMNNFVISWLAVLSLLLLTDLSCVNNCRIKDCYRLLTNIQEWQHLQQPTTTTMTVHYHPLEARAEEPWWNSMAATAEAEIYANLKCPASHNLQWNRACSAFTPSCGRVEVRSVDTDNLQYQEHTHFTFTESSRLNWEILWNRFASFALSTENLIKSRFAEIGMGIMESGLSVVILLS